MTLPFRAKVLLSSALVAAASLSPAAAEPATVIPADNPIPHQMGWLKECDDRIADAQGKQIDIIFLGDSITQNFVETPKAGWNLVGRSVWDKHYANRNALDLGVGSDGTEHILYRLDHEKIQDFTPKVVVLLAGVNDMQDSPEDIEAGIKAIIGKCRLLYPSAKIVLMGVLNNARNPAKTAAVNSVIQTYADNDTIYYLDLGPEMPAQGNGWKGVGGDGVHLTAEGYEIWASNLDPILDKLTGM